MKNWIIGLITLAGVCGATASGQQAPSPRADLVITNARLLDGSGEVKAGTGLVIEGKRITAILTDGETRRARITVDAAGGTVLPGLIDTHVHLVFSETITDEASCTQYIEDVVSTNLIEFLAHGVTTVRSIGDPLDKILELRAQLTTGELRGPRLLVVGPAFTAPDGHPAATVYGKTPWLRQHATIEVASVQAAREAIVRLASKGVNGIKIVYEGSDDPTQPYPNHWGVETIPRLSHEVLLALVNEAHQRGLRVTAHTVKEDAALAAVEAGVDGLEHGVSEVQGTVSDESLKRFRESGLFYVPTLQVFEALVPDVFANAGPKLKTVSGAGVKVALGSDTFGALPAGAQVIREAELMVAAGLSPATVVQAATQNAATHIGLGEEIGTLAPGKLADLIIVKGDPLMDIATLRRVWLVVKDGEITIDKRGASNE